MVSLGEDEVCAHEPESGYADSHSVTQGYATRARDMGARVIQETAVRGVEVRGGRVTGVATESGSIATPVAVVATGPWSRPFLGKLGVDVPLETVRHQVAALNRPVDRLPDHPAIGDLANDLSARPDGRDITMVGVGEEESAGPDSYDQGVDMEVVQDAWARLAKRIPGLEDARYRGGWSGLFTTTPDWHPILGPVEGIEGLYCAVGFSGHGFKLSPMVGVAMAEMITRGRASTVDVSMLGLDRFKAGKPMISRYRMAVLA
jgi:sarcosine oxidase subunit beta